MNTKSKIAILLATICWLYPLSGLTAHEPKFKVVTKRADDRLEITSSQEATTVSVRSQFGISSAVLSRVDDRWPKRMILRLYLQGLEGLKLSNGKTELVAEVSRADNKRYLHVTHNQQQAATRFDECEIRALDNNGRPSQAVPLKLGYFEVPLPKELFATNPESITINWVDFYR